MLDERGCYGHPPEDRDILFLVVAKLIQLRSGLLNYNTGTLPISHKGRAGVEAMQIQGRAGR